MKQLLSNPTYIGKHKALGASSCDQLIEEALFRRVQAKMEMTKAAYVGRPARKTSICCAVSLVRGMRRRWITNPGLKRAATATRSICAATSNTSRTNAYAAFPPIHCEVFERVCGMPFGATCSFPNGCSRWRKTYYAALEQPDSAVATQIRARAGETDNRRKERRAGVEGRQHGLYGGTG